MFYEDTGQFTPEQIKLAKEIAEDQNRSKSALLSELKAMGTTFNTNFVSAVIVLHERITALYIF